MSYFRTETLIAGILLLAGAQQAAHAQTSPYVDLTERVIKALSAEDVAALRSGAGMGYALAAELNHYPGPKHVIELRDSLALTPAQTVAIDIIYAEMLEAAKHLGEQVIAAELHIDSMFGTATITPETLELAVTRAAAAEARLRIVHLGAHLKIRSLLNEHQRHTYDRLRGYGEGHLHVHGND